MSVRRHLNRKAGELRDITIKVNYNPYAEGSCLVKFGNTHIICTASIEENVPPFLKGQGRGWVTGEYGMIPRSTHTRVRRDAAMKQPNGRTVEIQRLIGRSLRSIMDLNKLGERQVIIDCDVLQADGGTRTAAITGGYVALRIAMNYLLETKKIKADPIIGQIAAVSCGVVSDTVLVDIDYSEDSKAQVDGNFVMTDDGRLVEIQSTAEDFPFTVEQFNEMLSVASKSIKALIEKQNAAINEHHKNSKTELESL